MIRPLGPGSPTDGHNPTQLIPSHHTTSKITTTGQSVFNVQTISSLRTGKVSHSPMPSRTMPDTVAQPEEKHMTATYEIKDLQSSVCCILCTLKCYFYKGNQPGTPLPKTTHCYNRIPFLPSSNFLNFLEHFKNNLLSHLLDLELKRGGKQLGWLVTAAVCYRHLGTVLLS